jgi:hypothetical protein
LLKLFSLFNVDSSYKNDTNWVSWWWDMTDWWWTVGFTLRAIRHVRRYWQLSSSAISRLHLGAKLWSCQLGHPFFRPPSTTSGICYMKDRCCPISPPLISRFYWGGRLR